MQGIASRHPPGGVAIITGELARYVPAMRCIESLQVPAGSASVWRAGVLVSFNLNEAFRTIMANPRLEWAWLMGDDHTFPPDTLMKLLDRDVDVVVPLCLNRSVPMDPTIIEGPRLKFLEDLPASGLYTLTGTETCGDAGMLIRRRVLEATGPDWYDRKKSGSHNAEDREFVQKIREAGFDVHVDVDNPIGHLTTFEILPVRKDTGWEIRLSAGLKPVCDLGAMRR